MVSMIIELFRPWIDQSLPLLVMLGVAFWSWLNSMRSESKIDDPKIDPLVLNQERAKEQHARTAVRLASDDEVRDLLVRHYTRGVQ